MSKPNPTQVEPETSSRIPPEEQDLEIQLHQHRQDLRKLSAGTQKHSQLLHQIEIGRIHLAQMKWDRLARPRLDAIETALERFFRLASPNYIPSDGTIEKIKDHFQSRLDAGFEKFNRQKSVDRPKASELLLGRKDQP